MYGVEDIHTEAIHTSMIHIHMYKMSLYHYWQKNQNKCNLEIVTFSIFKSMSLWWKFKFSLLFFPLMKHLSTYSLVIFPNTAVTVLIFNFRNKQ